MSTIRHSFRAIVKNVTKTQLEQHVITEVDIVDVCAMRDLKHLFLLLVQCTPSRLV